MSSSTLDILDSFFAIRADRDFSTVPGRVVHEFGEQVRQMTRASRPAFPANGHPIYIGGWPSANFGLVRGDLLLTSLLYNEQILIRDPIADWFSDEQYLVEHAMASRPGYWDVQGNRARMQETRQFLNVAVDRLRALRPLIDVGIVTLVPTSALVYEKRKEIDALVARLESRPELQPATYSASFSPADIPVEDNVRGMFVFAPGPDSEPQIAAALRRGLLYFAREYVVAAAYGATYTAAFDHELFLCRTGAREFVRPSTRVSEAILQSQVPIFTGLTPTLIAKIHDDDMFGQFRADLHELLENAPANGTQADLSAYVSDQERVRLEPRLVETRKSVDRGLLGRIGAGLNAGKFGIAAGLAIDVALQSPGLATGLNLTRAVTEGVLGARPQKSQRIWASLIRHQRTVGQELRDIEPRAGTTAAGWQIPAEPSMSVTVMPGSIIHDFVPRTSVGLPDEPAGYAEGNYRSCTCGSGLKYRFCCESADRNGPTFT